MKSSRTAVAIRSTRCSSAGAIAKSGADPLLGFQSRPFRLASANSEEHHDTGRIEDLAS